MLSDIKSYKYNCLCIYIYTPGSPLSCSPLVSTLRHRLPLVRAPLTVEELSILVFWQSQEKCGDCRDVLLGF